MFSKAVPIAAGFTRPVVISSRTAQGECTATIGAYVVVNREGWILTASHLLEIVRAQQDSARRHAGYQGNVVEFHRDTAADKRYRKKGVRTFHQPAGASVRNHSVWWGMDGVRLVEARVVPAADLALGRLEPFDPGCVAHYPVWKDPSRDFAPGRSLCKLGFPLYRIVPIYDEKANTFTLPRARYRCRCFPWRGCSPAYSTHGRRGAGTASRAPSSRPRRPASSDRWAVRSSIRMAWCGGSSRTRCTMRSGSARQYRRAGRRARSSTSSSTPDSPCTRRSSGASSTPRGSRTRAKGRLLKRNNVRACAPDKDRKTPGRSYRTHLQPRAGGPWWARAERCKSRASRRGRSANPIRYRRSC